MDPQLVALERRLYRSAVDIGVWDVLIGSALLTLGGGIAVGYPQLGAFAIPALVAAGPVLLLLATRRVGSVRFAPARMRAQRRNGFVLSAASLVLLAVLLLGDDLLPAMFKAAAMLAAPVAFAGYLFDIRRFWAYAAIIILAVVVVVATAGPGEFALIAAGALIASTGSVVLCRALWSGHVGAAR